MSTVILLFVLSAVVALALVALVEPKSFKAFIADTRGQLGMANVALVDRGGNCMLPRIPTGRYPHYSTTLFTTLDAAGNGTIEFKAERDTLFIGMSATVDDAVPHSSTISAEYCNTKYLVRQSTRVWARCCDRKPIFLVGVSDNKRMVFTVNGGTPAGNASITLWGFQGNGCCP